MHPTSFVPIALLIVSALAGCVAESDAAAAPIVAKLPSGAEAKVIMKSGSAGEQKQPSAKPDARPEARNLSAKVHFDTHLVFLPYPVSCDPAKPWVCDLYYVGTSNISGAMIGSAQVSGHMHNDGDNGRMWAEEVYSFSGSVPGCGSGSLTFVATGWGTTEANLGGVVHVHADAALVPGSQSIGLAGLVDFQGVLDQRLTGQFGAGDINGNIWCR